MPCLKPLRYDALDLPQEQDATLRSSYSPKSEVQVCHELYTSAAEHVTWRQIQFFCQSLFVRWPVAGSNKSQS